MAIRKVVNTKYVSDDGFEFMFEPIEDTLTITEREGGGFEARYLCVDEDPWQDSPDAWGDNGLFLVHYHRDFTIERDSIITEQDLRNWYRREFDDYEDEHGIIPTQLPQEERYWIFEVSALIHGMVHLYLGRTTPSCDPGGWDTSHVGAVLASRDEWPKMEDAERAAESLINEWNMYLGGEIYGAVIEVYDSEKMPKHSDSVWGLYGMDHAKEALGELIWD